MNVYASTSCLGIKDVKEVLQAYADAGIVDVELGSSHDYCEDLSFLDDFKFNYLVHNYFPASEVEFIMNPASLNKKIHDMTVEQMKKSIRLCAKLGSPLYTFHPPYLQDPDNSFRFDRGRPVQDYEESYNKLIETIRFLIDYAKEFNVKLAIENNIVSTHDGDVKDFSMLYDLAEFLRLFKDIDTDEFGMLLDLGHLKVNANLMGFDPDESIDAVKDRVMALHVHDNDGSADTHQVFDEDCWAAKTASAFNCPKIIESKSDISGLKRMIEVLA